MVLSGDTSGTITVTVPAVAGTNTATLPAATGTVMVSGNMPAFSAYNSSVQSIAGSTFTKVQFQTKEFDTANCFDATTNYRFTPNVAGYYQVTLCVTNAGSTWTNGFLNGLIYKNGSLFKSSASTQPVNGNYASGYCNALIYMNGTTDYIEGYTISGGNSANWNTATGANYTYFQAVMVRTA
jgi:hypothetical protein